MEDAPGLALGRIVAQLVNEAAFAIGEGVGSADDVDTGLTLGLSYPRGPVAWSEATGLEHVPAVPDGCGASAARSAIAPRRSSGAPRRSGA